MRAKLVNESLGYMQPEFQSLIDLLEKYDLHFDPDYTWDIEGEEELSDQGYDDYKKLEAYSFNLGNTFAMAYQEDPINLEIITDNNDKQFFQFYWDSSPIVTGDGRTMNPDHQPIASLNDEFVERLVEYLNNR